VFVEIFDAGLSHSLRSALLVDHCGLPRYWSTVWMSISLSALADTTRTKKLRHIERLYRHADQLRGQGALDDALSAVDHVALAEILESWFVTIINQPETTRADELRWKTGLEFVVNIITWISKSRPFDTELRLVEKRIHQLNLLYGQLHIRRQRSTETIRSLPASVVQELYNALDPESSRNPFKQERTRWRVYVTFILMLHQGLRRGEVLLLATDSIKSAFDRTQDRNRHWLNVQNNPYDEGAIDTRYSRPSIKTVSSIRQIPVSDLVSGIIQTYTDNFRGKPEHPFLLNSQLNSPLSTESISKAFTAITQALPATALKELEDRTGKCLVSPHDLRHTCAVLRLNQLLEQKDPMDVALSKLRTFFGWSKASDMPTRYARAVFEDRLAEVWNNTFDDRVDLLRSIPS